MCTESQCRITHVGFVIVAFAVPTVDARRNQRVAEAEGCTLEGVCDARMSVQLISFVIRHLFAEKRRQVLVHYYVLESVTDLW